MSTLQSHVTMYEEEDGEQFITGYYGNYSNSYSDLMTIILQDHQ